MGARPSGDVTMSRCRPISLSDAQLAIVLDAARSLAPGHARARFLNHVADALIDVEVTDASVERAVEAAIAQLLTPAA